MRSYHSKFTPPILQNLQGFYNIYIFLIFKIFGTGGQYIETPKWLKRKKTNPVINIKNNDNFCFLYSILAHYYSKKIRDKKLDETDAVNYQEYLKELNYEAFTFPFHYNQVQ